MRHLSFAALILVPVLCCSQSVSQAQPAPDSGAPLVVPRTGQKITIDGVLGTEEWKDALVMPLRYEIKPGDNTAPVVPTEVMLTFDDDTLYAGFRCHDPEPESIVAHLSDRERCLNDDHVNIQLDTFNDERRHYTIGASAYGVQLDALTESMEFDWSWDAIFDSAGKIHDWGYAVELAIPFNQLRFQRTDGPQVWGFDAWRAYPRSLLHFFNVVGDDRNNDSHESEMIKIVGFEGARPGKDLEINPTITSLHTEARDVPGGDFATVNSTTEAGITASWAVTPSMALSATINPDFSQVEADARQLDINEPFALYFSEKRPFFLEGKDFFSSPLVNAIYTRTLRDPVWGAKAAGREGANAFGAFVVQDDVTKILFPGSQFSTGTSMNTSALASVVRYTHDFGNRYTLGALATSREGDEYFNRVFGVDGELRLSDSDRLMLQLVGSATRYPDDVAAQFEQPEGEFRDRAFDITYSHTGSHFNWWASTENYGTDFRADLGYVPQVDYRIYKGAFGYEWRPEGDEKSWYSRIELEGMYHYREDQSGTMLTDRFDIYAAYEGPLQSLIAARIYQSREGYNGQQFDVTYFGTYTGFWPTTNLNLALDTSFGDMVDYTNTQLGHRIRLQPQMSWKIGDHFAVNLDHHYERLKVRSEQLYRAAVSQGTFSYQFNIRAMLRLIMQHVDYRYNPDLYVIEVPTKQSSFFNQLLFSYKINPRTLLFIGYSDNYVGTDQFSLTQSDRTLFAKIGYAWQL